MISIIPCSAGWLLLCAVEPVMVAATDENKKLADMLREMSLMYRYLGDRERFRCIAFQKAARTIGALPRSIRSYTQNQIDALPGIGESIGTCILQFLSSGSVPRYKQLQKRTPYQLLDIMELKGVGPQTLKKIVTALGVETRREFSDALRSGKIGGLPGFGSGKEELLLRGFKLYKEAEERMLLWDAVALGRKVTEWLIRCKGVTMAEVAGSIRRRKETIGDIDLLAACDDEHRSRVINYFTSGEMVGRVIARGNQRASIVLSNPKKQVDLRLIHADDWGAALHYFTGSKEHNIHLRTIAHGKGCKISEYGVFKLDNGERLGGLHEEDIYTALGYQIMPPEMREDKGELLLSRKHAVPSLIGLADVKGDLHVHSTCSDGMCTPEDLYRHVRTHFNYEYMVITDHSRSSRIAKGMSESQILRQLKNIRALNERNGNDFIKAGIEVDILKDGRLDISNEVLAQLDWVTAAVHSQFGKDNTERLIRACEHPYVCCIAHPTGRLIGYREAYPLDISALIRSALRTGTALEINAQPARMDLKDDHAMEAAKQGVKLVINTDAHALKELGFMQLGVFIARRAWCTPAHILNTLDWAGIEQFKAAKRGQVLQTGAPAVHRQHVS